MKKIWIAILILALTQPATSQVFRKNGEHLDIDHSKGIVLLYSSAEGELYLNDQLFTSVYENDTLYIANLEPGEYTMQLKGIDYVSQKYNISIAGRKVTQLTISKDTFSETNAKARYSSTAGYIAGKQVVFIREKAVYLNLNHDLIFAPNSFALAATYQIIPEFCAGAGIMNYRSMSWDRHLLPVYLHLISYFGSGKIAPYIKLDLGGMIFLKDSGAPEYGSLYEERIHTGLYFAPGVGFRFEIIKNLSGIAEIDHRSLKYTVEEISTTGSYEYFINEGNLFEISVGLGYQF